MSSFDAPSDNGAHPSRDDAAFLLRRIQQAAWRYAMHRESANRAGSNAYLDLVAANAWSTMQRTINEATNPSGVEQWRHESTPGTPRKSGPKSNQA